MLGEHYEIKLIACMKLIRNVLHPSPYIITHNVDFLIFRQFVISHLFHLEYLDDSPVTAGEREAARKIYGKRRPSALSSVGKTPSSQVRIYVCGWVWLVGVACWHFV